MADAEQVDAELARMLESCAVCRPWAEQDEGPYHRPAPPLRRDITEGRRGVPLKLGLRLLGQGAAPRSDASVDVWHCDALGRYSGFRPPDPAASVTTDTAPRDEHLPHETFLRGRQVADQAGMVELHTIYPGWYPGRTVHIHLIAEISGMQLTTQLYFDETVSERVFQHPPYNSRPGRDTTNDSDEIFGTGGEPAILDLRAAGTGFLAGACLLLPAGASARGR